MESTQRTQPNTLLRQQRLLRGWSLQHVVEQLCSLCQEEEDVPGVTKDMVSKWERSERKPSRFYQTKLCLLYNTSADQLGFIEAQDMPEEPPPNKVLSELSNHTFISDPLIDIRTLDTLLSGEQAEAQEILAA